MARARKMGYFLAVARALAGFLSLLSVQLHLPTGFDFVSRPLPADPVSQDSAAPPQSQPQPPQVDAARPGDSDVDQLFANCPQLPTGPPATSIRALRPADIKVVAAVGDSVTAAFAAVGHWPLEFRYLSFPIGGGPGRVTLPNILGRFAARPPLVGAATGDTDPLWDAASIFRPEPLGPVPANVAHLNAAVSNARSPDGVSQVEWLTEVMRRYESQGLMSMQQDWKHVTLELGANDLRAQCHPKHRFPVDEVARDFKQAMNQTLALMRQRFPRTFVSLLAVPNVGDMTKFAHSTWVCTWVQTHLETPCPPGGRTTVLQEALNSALKELADYWTNVVRAEDFAVVYHPFSGDLALPNVTYLSEADCFHPGERGHAVGALSLWNSLLTPQRNKSTSADVGRPPICPTADSVLRID